MRKMFKRTTTYKSSAKKNVVSKKPVLEGIKKKKQTPQYPQSAAISNRKTSSPSAISNKIRSSIFSNGKSESARTPESINMKSSMVVKVVASKPKAVTTDKISKHAQKFRYWFRFILNMLLG